MKKRGNGDFLVVCLMSMILYMGSCESIVSEFKSCMMGKFEMYDLRMLHYFLRLEVKQGSNGIFILQRNYATELLQKFNMLNCNTSPTPMNTNEKLVLDDGTGTVNASYFRSLLGGRNYLSHTGPVIAFSVSLISRFMHSPSKQHLGAAKRILRYVAGTISYGIWYSKVSDFRLIGFTDSDWAVAWKIAGAHLGMSLVLVLEQSHGVQGNKIQSPCYLRKQSTWLQFLPVAKLFG